MLKCSYADKYQAKRPPRCNSGAVCDTCRAKWAAANERALAPQKDGGDAKFTPGPWWLEGTDVMANVSDHNEMIACAYGFENARGRVVTTRATRANARLIAAAPEMYAVILDAFNPSRRDSWEAKARAVISKAKGEA